MKIIRFAGLLASFMVLLSGCGTEPICLTHSLWTGQLRNSFYEPESNPHIELWRNADSSDVLVVYTEGRERDDKVRRRAYYVLANQHPVQQRIKPGFVSLKSTNTLSLVPTATITGKPANYSTLAPITADIVPDGRSFFLYRNGQPLGRYYLPVYHDRLRTAEVVVLTPLAATGDTIIYGSMVGVFLGLLWWAGGGGTL
jgi:hypothetical protein